MENDASPPSTTITTTAASTPPREETVKTTLHLENQNFGTDFASLYHSIFPPKSPLPTTATTTTTSISLMSSPSTCSSSIDDAISSTQNRLNQARLILQYQELNDHYDLCRARLIDLLSEAESLRHENAELRLANAELLKLLSSQASFHNLLLSSSYPNRSFLQDLRRLSTEDEEHSDNRTNLFDNRFSLPKSISVRSAGFTKANLPPPPVANTGPTPSRSSTRSRAPPSQLGSASQQQQQQQQRVYMAGKGEEDKEAVELEVYNQGMMKTELCNKWQETGACPYGDHCQFAHGITELRPVIRHPRYKTELCRMVLAGDTCPYGHRCHFRHTLTDQERSFLFAPPPR